MLTRKNLCQSEVPKTGPKTVTTYIFFFKDDEPKKVDTKVGNLCNIKQ